jgi:hypothetical protein
MGKTTVILEHILAKASVESVMFRMGYKKGKTAITPEQQKSIDDGIKLGDMLCELKGAYEIAGISSFKNNSVLLDNGITFVSLQLSELFKGCDNVLLMAATAGSGIVERRDREIKEGNAALGVILDSVGSETADAGLDWIQDFMSVQSAKKARAITRRFSPGYGDLKLMSQKDIYNALNLEKIGVNISERCLLTPEKSVIAVAGIK